MPVAPSAAEPVAASPVTAPAVPAKPATATYTEAQADRGRSAFRATCAECHYSSEFRGSQFQFSWRRRSVGDLYGDISRNMPEDDPGSLEPQVYVDVVAYILQLNGFPAGETELPADETVLDGFSMAAPAGGAPQGGAP